MLRRIVTGVLAFGLASLLFFAGFLKPLDDRLTALRFELGGRSPTGSTAVVEIDSQSLAAVGTWPWPRSIHARIVDELHRHGAAEIAFDIDFSARSTPDQDAIFADALARAGGTAVLAVFNQRASADSAELIASSPIPELAANAWPATVNVRPDADGLVRQFSTGETIDGVFVPSMPMMLAGGSARPDNFFIDFGIDAFAIDRISAVDLLDGRVEEARIAGRRIIIGSSAAELRDIFQVPVWGFISGPHLQAIAAESLLLGRALHRPAAGWAVATAALALLAAALSFRRTGWHRRLAVTAVIGGLCEGAALLAGAAFPLLPDTSLAQASLALFGAGTVLWEIDVRRILLAIARTDARNTRTLLERVVEDSFAGIVVADADGRILSASRTAEALLGGASAPLAGSSVSDRLPGELLSAVRASLDQDVRAPGTQRGSIVRGDGDSRIVDYTVTPSRLAGGLDEEGRRRQDRRVATLTFLDVTERHRAEADLAFLARFDPLTGLANRNQLLERLGRTEEAGGSAHVVVIDLDRFRQVNAALGYEVGDRLLRAAADRLRPYPVACLARIGADEFAFVAEGLEQAEVESLAGRMQRDLARPYVLDDQAALVGASVGIARVPDAGDPAVSIRHADVALHRAKAAGGDRCCLFSPAMVSGIEQRRELEMGFRGALERDEFQVVYQPQVDLATGGIVGVEALVRWKHPKRGMVPPGEFIPLAEETGFIEPLGAFVLQRACRDAVAFSRPIKLSVNVSAAQFARGNLLALVPNVLATSGLPAGRLDLEITESLFINGSGDLRGIMDDITRLGVTFSLDDFGTGYSSLGYIRKFPVSKIKIDKSFVDDLVEDRRTQGIVRAVAELARALDLRLNAEGIEAERQAEVLLALGCGEGQGYLYGRPMGAPALNARLRKAEPRPGHPVGAPETFGTVVTAVSRRAARAG